MIRVTDRRAAYEQKRRALIGSMLTRLQDRVVEYKTAGTAAKPHNRGTYLERLSRLKLREVVDRDAERSKE